MIKASGYTHKRESKIKIITGEIKKASLPGNHKVPDKHAEEQNLREQNALSKMPSNFLRISTSNWITVFLFTLRSLVVMECSPTSFETNTIAESSSL